MRQRTEQFPIEHGQLTTSELARVRRPQIETGTSLDGLISSASRELVDAEQELAAAGARLRSVEPHPFAHGYSAGGDCRYAGLRPEHFEPLLGMFAFNWSLILEIIEADCRRCRHAYLLKAVPAVLDRYREQLVRLRPERPKPLTAKALMRDPFLGIGMAWFEIGFRRSDEDAWVGAFASGPHLRALMAATPEVVPDTSFGAALAATVHFWSARLQPLGCRERLLRAAERYAARQASWSEVDPEFRAHGPWRERPATKSQRHQIERIELAQGRLGPPLPLRGEASDWIAQAGGNPRFANLEKEND